MRKYIFLIVFIFSFLGVFSYELTERIFNSGNYEYKVCYDLGNIETTLYSVSNENCNYNFDKNQKYDVKAISGTRTIFLRKWTTNSNCELEYGGASSTIIANWNIQKDSKDGNFNYLIVKFLKDNFNKNIGATRSPATGKQILDKNLWMRVKVEYRNGSANGEVLTTEKTLLNDSGLSEDNLKNIFLNSEKYKELVNSLAPKTKLNLVVDVSITEDKCVSKSGGTKAMKFSIVVDGKKKSEIKKPKKFNIDRIIKTQTNSNGIKTAKTETGKNVIGIGESNDSVYFNGDTKKVISISKSKNIKKVVNGESINVSKKDVVLTIHKIKKLNDVKDTQEKLDKLINKTAEANINETLVYNSATNKTRVNITGNFKEGDIIYIFIPKDVVSSTDNITDIGKEKFFVVEKDPIIGYHFSNEGINYEIDGESSDVGLVLVDDDITYSSTHLIVNIKGNACENGEVLLYSLDNLRGSDSNGFNAGGSKAYNVCISHKDSKVRLGSGSGENIIGLNTEIARLKFSSSLFFERIISENQPSKEYVCVGSLDKREGTKKIGDCDFNKDNRVWVYIGDEDIRKLKTNIQMVSLSPNKASFKFNVINGDGGADIQYWVNGDYKGSVKENKIVSLKCGETEKGCKKIINFSAIKGIKREGMNIYEFNIPKEKSECSSDCKIGSQLRKECNGINGCFFYQYDDLGRNDKGHYSSIKCDFVTPGQKVNFGRPGLDLICPGTLKRSLNVGKIKIESSCRNIYSKKVSIKVDGEIMNLLVLMCEKN